MSKPRELRIPTKIICTQGFWDIANGNTSPEVIKILIHNFKKKEIRFSKKRNEITAFICLKAFEKMIPEKAKNALAKEIKEKADDLAKTIESENVQKFQDCLRNFLEVMEKYKNAGMKDLSGKIFSKEFLTEKEPKEEEPKEEEQKKNLTEEEQKEEQSKEEQPTEKEPE
jgi:7-cyano-7-deazaguanine synthase in queuosine biosynthesis